MNSLRQLLNDLLDYQTTLKRSKHTIEGTRSNCTAFIDWITETHNITTAEQLIPDHLHAYQKHLIEYTTKKGLPHKPSSLNTKVKGLRRLLTFLHDRAYTTRALIHDIHYIKEPQLLPSSVLTHKEVKKLLRQIDTTTMEGIRDRAAIELLYSAGVRIAELQSLEIDDISLDMASMKVTGKGNKERLVPIGKTALKHLTSYIRGARPFLAAATGDKTRTCFLNTRGRPLAGYALRQAIHAYADKARIDINVTPHTFRRSCTSEMIKANANLYHVKELLGHESFTTLKHYTKLHINDLRKTHAKCHPRERDDL
jgi:integrase/recombinase XerD